MVVDAVTADVAWSVGNAGMVVMTPDGGSNWTPVPVPGATGIRGLYAFDALNCVVADQTGKFWRTTNGGLDWIIVYGGTGGSINGIHFFDDQNGWAIGDPPGGLGNHFVILESEDGGFSWILSPNPPPVTPPTIGFARSFDWVGNDIGAFGTNRSVIWRTTNGGSDWHSVSMTLDFIPGLVLNQDGTGLAGGVISGEGAALERSTDYGQTWNTVDSPTTSQLITFDWIEGTIEVWGVTGQSGLYQSGDGGLAWTQHVLASSQVFIAEDVDFVDSNTGWCVGWNPQNSTGRIFKYSSTAGIATLSASMVPTKVLSYPNPFNSDVSIEWNGSLGDVEVMIYNASGRKVGGHFDKSDIGNGRYRWSARHLPNGTYFYRVLTGPHDVTGKIIKAE
jgi:photosystem II stability/assembly factor-like uncharacterized protein